MLVFGWFVIIVMIARVEGEWCPLASGFSHTAFTHRVSTATERDTRDVTKLMSQIVNQNRCHLDLRSRRGSIEEYSQRNRKPQLGR